ncbi:MAG: prolyl oligopeptidase family serine peptidase, partial [Clostridia bacterium]|nr:prolyl oligopeptidase family serine peptidase [Clostridia bacterium]
DMGFYSARMKPEEVNIGKCLMERSRTSIIRNLDHIRVPLLLLHGYKDYRCSFEQSEQMFIGLHELHPEVPVRLVMFHEPNHSVSRTGLLPHRQRHVQEMVDWFDRYLQLDTKEGGEAQ